MDNKNNQAQLGSLLLVTGVSVLVIGALVGGSVYLAKSLNKIEDNAVDNLNSQAATSSATSKSSSTSQESNVTTTPTLSFSKTAIQFSVKEGSFPTDSFTVALAGVGASATDEQKKLIITCDDADLDSWLKIWVTRSGTDVQLASPYALTSGETVHLQPLKVPTLQQEDKYKLSLLVKSTAFSLEKYVDVTIVSVA